MSKGADFSDLTTRIVSALTMVVIGLALIWVGGDAFGVLLIVVAGLLGWETSRMHSNAVLVHFAYGLVLAAAVLAVMFLPAFWAGALTVLVIGVGYLAHRSPATVIGVSIAVAFACYTLQILRADFGIGWTLWLLVVVIASDVGGYFAGKLLGGPKILPKISPKKTWSGTLGGWVLAAVIGGIAVWAGLGNGGIVILSVLVAIAAQIGDLLESLMKRRAGVKDSSNLIPGHGGLFDRFDGTLGASCAVGVVLALGGAGALGLG